MHIAEDDLYKLADAELKGTLLSDMQISHKGHLAGCRECYERYCAYITMLDLAGNAFGIEEEGNEEDEKSSGLQPESIYPCAEGESVQMQEIFLQIRLAGAFLSSVQARAENAAPYWNFMHMPQIAAARGSGDKGEADLYISRESEYSQIRQEGQRLVIQLDEEVFPVGLLGIRYKEDGMDITRRFVYNESTECHEVIIDRTGKTDDIVVEVVWLEAGE